MDYAYLLLVAPAFLLSIIAQMMVSSRYAQARQVAASMSGATAARRLLDSAGLNQVGIEQVSGRLSDHYDPRHKVLRLSSEVYQGRNLAAVGIAAHEAGHALQDASRYAPLVIRNAAVPAAGFGSNAGFLLALLGVAFRFQPLLLVGIALFSAVVFFQLINLPVEFNASSRAKRQLVAQGVVHPQDMTLVNKVLNAAAMTYVAATLQSALTLLYFVLRFMGNRR